MNKRQRPELDPDRLRYVAEQAVAALSKTGRPPPPTPTATRSSAGTSCR